MYDGGDQLIAPTPPPFPHTEVSNVLRLEGAVPLLALDASLSNLASFTRVKLLDGFLPHDPHHNLKKTVEGLNSSGIFWS